MTELIYLILGLTGLVLGARLIIKGALNVAEHFKISQLFIGLTVVAIGTSLPELIVAIAGAIHRNAGMETSGLVLGNVVGSCFGQILLTLGIVGLFATLTLTKRELIRDGLTMVGSVVLFFFLGLDGKITGAEGAALLFVYLIYFLILQREEKPFQKFKIKSEIRLEWVIISLIAGFAILIYSSNVVVENAIRIAELWGVRQSLIGILIVGLGTNLPEMVVSIGSLRKKAFGLSVGNLIGSNIFNILVTLGVGSVISGFLVNGSFLKFDIPFLFASSLLALFFFGKKAKMGRIEALALLAVYVIYVVMKLAYL